MDERAMVWRRGVRRALLAACLALVLAPESAPATSPETIRLHVPVGDDGGAKPRSVFRAETEGSPQPTIVGGWSEDASSSNEARLTFAGGHAIGQRTNFMGTWVGPPSTSSRSPQMSVDYQLVYSNALGEKIPLVHSARARFAGGKWGPWASARTPIAPSESSITSGNINVTVDLKKPRRVQFQWKISGVISGPAAVHGDFRLGVS